MSWPWEHRTDVNPWWPETQRMVDWLFAHTCDANCPYCYLRMHVPVGARWWTDAEAVAAWRSLAEHSGPCHIRFTGLEPSEQLALLSKVLEYHKGSMLTNLTFDLAEFFGYTAPDRLRIHPSFHPHLWAGEIGAFLKKLVMIGAEGYGFPFACVVGYPPHLPYIKAWVAEAEAADVRLVALPFQGLWDGRKYPDAYSDEEWAAISNNVSLGLHGEKRVPPLPMTACGAGFACAHVRMDGAIWRCNRVSGMEQQNLIRDGNITWLDAPAPCPIASCQCTQYHQYHIRGDASDDT